MLIKYRHFVEIEYTDHDKSLIKEQLEKKKKSEDDHHKELYKNLVNKPSRYNLEYYKKYMLRKYFYYKHSYIKDEEIDRIEVDDQRLVFSIRNELNHKKDFSGLGDILFEKPNYENHHLHFGVGLQKYPDPNTSPSSHKVIVHNIIKKDGEIIEWVSEIEYLLNHSLKMKIDDLSLLLSKLEKIDSNHRLDNILNNLQDIKKLLKENLKNE